MLKGAMHVHSNISPDSTLSRSSIKKLFKENGYSFVLLTEHAEDLDDKQYALIKQEYDNLSDDNFLMIPGLEIKWKERIHFLAYGAKRYIQNECTLSFEDTIRKIRRETECDFLVWGHFSHPFRVNEELASLAGMVDGIEISNVGYHGQFFCDWRGLVLLNRLKKAGKSVRGLNGLDMHEESKLGKIYCLVSSLKLPDRKDIFDAFKNNKVIFKNPLFAIGQARYGILFILFSLLAELPLDYYRRVKTKTSGFADNHFNGYIKKCFQAVKRLKRRLLWNQQKS